MSDDAVPLRLLKHLHKALSHRIRTPLSVISNDLQFLNSQYPHAELDRTIAQCKKITDVLTDCVIEEASREAIDRHIGHLAKWESRPGSEKHSIVITARVETTRSCDFLLFSEAFNEILSQDTVHAPILDALCLSLGIKIAGRVRPGAIEVELIFPA